MNGLVPPRFQFRQIPWESRIHPRHGQYNKVETITTQRAENILGKAARDLRGERLEPGEPK